VKSDVVKQNAVSFIVGLLFAIGLALSGMTQPQKVIGFLNPWDWDPALLFVMIGAIGVHALSYPLVRKRKSPLFDTKWHMPTRKDLSARLVLGSAIFGLGWGLGGYCPGPGVTSLVSGDLLPIMFVVSMVAGMLFFKKTERHLKLRA
jgi:uncharacterized membrane protein YedE/YeeE